MNVLWSKLYLLLLNFNSNLNELLLLAYFSGVQPFLAYWHHAFRLRPYFWLVVTSWQWSVFLGCSVFTALLIKGFRHQTYTHQQHSTSGVPTTTVAPSHKRPHLPLSYPRVPAALRVIEWLHCVERGTWFWLVPNLGTHSHTQQGQLPLEAHLNFISCRRQQAIAGVAWQPLVIGWETKGGAKLHGHFNYWLMGHFFSFNLRILCDFGCLHHTHFVNSWEWNSRLLEVKLPFIFFHKGIDFEWQLYKRVCKRPTDKAIYRWYMLF